MENEGKVTGHYGGSRRLASSLLFQFMMVRDSALKAFWVVLDQGMFALSNFVINILFARWLSPIDYGWFVLSLSACLFITYIHWNAILEPLIVQSAKLPLLRRRSYIISLVEVHIIMFIAAGSLAATGYAIASTWLDANAGLVIVGGLGGSVAYTTLATGRRLCAIFVSPKASSIVGVVCLCGSVLAGVVMHTFGTVGWFDIWLIVGGCSLIGSVCTFWLAYSRSSPGLSYPISEVFVFARRYAHWGLGAAIAGWLQLEGLYIILAQSTGLAAVAETRAVLNLAAPLFQLNFAAHLTAIAKFSSDGSTGSKKTIWRIVAFYSTIALVMFPIIRHYSAWLVALIYNGRFVDGAWQLPIFCFGLCLNVMDSIISSFSKAQGRLASGYASTYVTGVVAVVVGLVLIPMQRTLIYVWVIECSIALSVSLALRMMART